MKISKLYSILPILTFGRTRSLIHTTKICKDCKYFIANKIECGKFGDTDLVTGKISYNYARSVRMDENKCGEEAKHFEKNNFKIVTVPYYFIVDILPFFFVFVWTGFITIGIALLSLPK